MEIVQPNDIIIEDGVTSLNGLTGDLNLVAGTNITSIVPSGTSITINATTQTPTLNATDVGYGSAGNTLTGTRDLTFTTLTHTLQVGQSATNIGIISISSSGGAGGASITTDSGATQMIFKNFSGNTVATMDNNASTILSGMLQEKMGQDITAASTITFPFTGNYFHITGNTTINLWNSTGIQDGTEMTVLFTGKGTIKNNQTASGQALPILLANSVDLTTNNNNLRFIMRLDTSVGAWIQITPVVVS